MGKILEFDDVTRIYQDKRGIQSLSFSVASGEIVALLGPSGCGKTTALRLAAGLERPESGRIFLKKSCVAGEGTFIPPEHRDIGIVFQDYALFPHLSVLDNILFGLRQTQKNRAYALSLLDFMRMSEYGHAFPHTLSGGQQQRVAIARAMAPSPTLLLLDEPFSGLDARLRDQVRDQTLHLLQENKMAAVIVTHDAEEAMYLADRIIVLQNGSIIQNDTPSMIYKTPVNAFVTRFFGEVNQCSGVVNNQTVETALGLFAASDFTNGTYVDVLIRPEGVSVSSKTKGYQARVLSNRLLGWTRLLHLDAFPTAYSETPVHVHARINSGMTDQHVWAPGDIVSIEVDPSAVHIFKTRSA